MVATQTTLTNPAEFTRCDDRSLASEEEQHLHQKRDKTDGSIAEKVDIALWNYRDIEVNVKEAIVYLSGHVPSTTIQQKAEDTARMIRGVQGIKSNLLPDDKLSLEVAGALGKIEHTYGVKFFTGVQNGFVVLNGEMSSAEARDLAEKCAAGIPGVRGVLNGVRTPGIDLLDGDQRFLQPAVGEPIYFRDGLCGTVHKVIMNPHNRRVIAMIVRGRYPNSPVDSSSLMYGEPLVSERLIAIPVSAIRHLTKSSGFLHIDSTEAAKTSDFDPACFSAPGEAWEPPYPYCPDDILFPIEYSEEKSQAEVSHLTYSRSSPDQSGHTKETF